MAKIKKRKLRWAASQSPQVVGYKLYWEEGGQVTYNSICANLGNIIEVVIPDGVENFSLKPDSGTIEFGITAVDELGNESDMITVSAPYQFNVPHAPGEIWLEGQKKGSAKEPKDEDIVDSDPLAFLVQEFDDEDEARVHRLTDNISGSRSSNNQQSIEAELKQQIERL